MAFLLVFICHGLAGSNRFYVTSRAGSAGMPLFFLLSSYLITVLLLKERRKTGTISIPRFFLRRILRIWPLYFLALTLAVLQTRFVSEYHISRHQIAAYLLFFGNWQSIRSGPIASPWSPLWSINLEEQFYLLWPFIAMLGIAALKRFSVFTLILGTAVLCYYGLAGARADEMRIWYNSFFQFAFFGLGALLALALDQWTPAFNSMQRAALSATSLLLFYVSSWISIVPPQSTLLVVLSYALTAVGCLALFLAFDDWPNSLPPWWIRLGRISFGLYVFHGPAISLVNRHLTEAGWPDASLRTRVVEMIVALLLTILFAEISYRLWEEPFLKLKKRFETIHSRPVS